MFGCPGVFQMVAVSDYGRIFGTVLSDLFIDVCYGYYILYDSCLYGHSESFVFWSVFHFKFL